MTARAQAMSLKRVASKFTHERFRRADSNLARERAIVSEIGLWESGMDDWDNFYMLAGGTAGTLIGIIFVVITLGIDLRGRATNCASAFSLRQVSSISPASWSSPW
jgi:hypothetical protein